MPRKIFGNYLTEMLQKAISEALRVGITVEVIRDKVTHIEEKKPYLIETCEKKIFFADYIVLMTGNNKPKDMYHLRWTPRYIHLPYPLYKNLKLLDAGKRIGIIGNSLTAIDIALSLDYADNATNVTLLSRLHLFPRIRSASSIYELQFLTSSAIRKLKAMKKQVSLRDILRLFRKELKTIHYPWKSLFVEYDQAKTLEEFLIEEIATAQQEKAWQAILRATNKVVEETWQALDDQSKVIFVKYFERMWLSNRSPMPLENARALLKLTQAKKLFAVSHLQQLYYDDTTEKYIAITQKGNVHSFDWILNASGPSRYVGSQDQLIYHLIQNGLARAHPLGGVEVDFNTAALINSQGQLNPHIRLLGHNTIGVYQYTSSLEMLAKKAAKIAHLLVDFIKKDKPYGQDQLAHTPHSHCPGYFAKVID